MKSRSLIFYIILLPFTCLSGCTKSEQEREAALNIKYKTFLALGDSYTIGESVTVSERFPAQTAAILKSREIYTRDVQYVAKTGWTTADLQSDLGQITSLLPSYDVVTLLIGVNDQFQGLDTAGYRTRFSQLLRKAIQLAGDKITHVFVLSIPDYSATPFGAGSAKASREIDAFNAINKEVTLSYKVSYIDITPISKQAATDPALTAKDGLHPSAKQYELWSVKLAEAIEGVLR